MHEPRTRIDPHDPIACSRWALRLGTNVRELKAAIHQFGSAADAVAYGLQQWRLDRSRGQWKARSGAPQVGLLSDSTIARGELLSSVAMICVNAIGVAAGAVPRVLPAAPEADVEAYLDGLDGLFVGGGQTNVHPSRYGKMADQAHDGPFDEFRDEVALRLIPHALARGIPTLFVCRGSQELNVAFGGTLAKEPDSLPEDKRHGTPEADNEDSRYRLRQKVTLRKDGILQAICGADTLIVNSLHSFLIADLAPGLVAEAIAEDGSVEAISVEGASAFALGTMFHPDYWASTDHASARILSTFGDAVRQHARAQRTG
ncbi:gamma-glutamyl-gamma-aminobutyrate hydrolase family protein [Bradyrhizobium sp. BWC-3-1]|uniref:gamma-glutamyl-gamma-aminobutyrate hydrolase family protein n=1 Tax=Bradyrhizobium sp. BWC-3-1 TaxID=3080012 RepID=UPI00293F02FD|nr:gamma-glutamyl-gamma-aminobutyrate hydrolase family protein [Bradyrhizobium sp. BWC-3-1]WOH60252.1 gamma-glutamyl-gamma-aminobutyrate hydrolase family protein [Bradyrhizobium sp. BWC-3-1]